MKIRWLGHSCFLITAASGRTLLTDPFDTSAYPGQLLFDDIDESPDVVTVSHGHADHNNVAGLAGEPVVVTGHDAREEAGFAIRGVSSFHDSEGGARRGGNTIYLISADGLTVCHMGDIGHELEAAQVAEVGSVDVLLVPVGGNFTVDAAGATAICEALKPAVAIPMHFRNDKCLFAVDGVDGFLAGKPGVERPGTSELELTKETLPAGPKIAVLEPAN